jgi:hypothetical protein
LASGLFFALFVQSKAPETERSRKLQAVTLSELAGSVSYNVRLPEAGLGWEKMGPLFERYSVTLVGDVDSHWADTYKQVVTGAPGLVRFRLDKDHTTVSFTCRSTDGPVEVMGVLKILEGLIGRVNREASLSAADEPEASPARTVEPRRGDAGAHPQRGGLFARFATGTK